MLIEWINERSNNNSRLCGDELYNKRSIGKEQEDLAVSLLEQEGYEILEQNFFSRNGEIDIIGRENEYLVFIEVKYRSNNQYGAPEEAISKKKMTSIYRTAMYYMLTHGYSDTTPCRFDVIVIQKTTSKLIRNAFQLNDFY